MNRVWLTIVVVVVGFATGLALSQRPWDELRSQKHQRADTVKEMRKAEVDRADLIAEAARMQNPAGKERVARSRGFYKPGETPVDESK